MPIRYDPILLSVLGVEIEDRWRGSAVRGLWIDPDRREAWIAFEASASSGPEFLGFLLHPERGHVIRAATAPCLSSARGHPFRRLRLSAAGAPPDERRLIIEFAGGRGDSMDEGRPVFRVHVELMTNQWNAILTRGPEEQIEDAVWSRSGGGRVLRRGNRYEPPGGSRRWIDRDPSVDEWLALLRAVSREERRGALLRNAAWTSSLNVEWVLGQTDEDDAMVIRKRYLDLRDPEARGAWILEDRDDPQPYPLPVSREVSPCADILDAMQTCATRSGAWVEGNSPGSDAARLSSSGEPEPASDLEALQAALEKRLRRTRKMKSALERQAEGEDAANLRHIGHLLLARQAEIRRGAADVTIADFDGTPVRIELDPRLDAVRNADRYYERARRRERAARSLPARISTAAERIESLEEALAALRAGADRGELWNLVGGRHTPGGTRPRTDAPVPYRRFVSSSGLEIRVGRTARGNDDLTFRHSAPEDIWLHARQSPGAHVILRWGRKDQNPPRDDLLEAANLAAVHSEARHSSLVAVDWTRRKYVRKPRKAPPGAVVPDRVNTLFVKPDRSVTERLSRHD